ncbi:signal peptide prediction [Xinfangfangia sp. D13-10-4-6]|uniref:ABC transporter substrate-binding protein n=1 Tax=Pseudogemmobacter hezensis TaxID=2737662 RepID=UPI0015520A85|nr:extracellular solute-binding protein [Pseudogemmobacter hezensis]NPD14016.1 signal peptide prediction [Pseudogemmobacter hezensis]
MTEPVLRVIGTPATLIPALTARAQQDLPFRIVFEALDGLDCQRRVVMSPGSFDVCDQWFHALDLFWTAASIQPVETARITRWPEVTVAGTPIGARPSSPRSGSWPGDLLFVQPGRSLGPRPLGERPQIAMLPTTYNVDSFAITPELAASLAPDEAQSWAWLLDGRWHGRTALAADPAASVVELALAARAAGLVAIQDPGDLTIEEIDALFAVLMPLRRAGHFTRFWATSDDAVRLMMAPGSGGPMISAMWSPACYTLRGQGRRLHYAAPAEGYRGWHSGLCLSAAASGAVLDMAYAYLNWWLDGMPGAIMARQGYYISVPGPLRETLTPQEWAYWYDGQTAATDLPGSDGTVVVHKGERREGGSYQARVARVAVWSTIMPEHNYLVRRWRQFMGD